jgi:hypothetical protein
VWTRDHHEDTKHVLSNAEGRTKFPSFILPRVRGRKEVGVIFVANKCKADHARLPARKSEAPNLANMAKKPASRIQIACIQTSKE